jgi:hypothetical protein
MRLGRQAGQPCVNSDPTLPAVPVSVQMIRGACGALRPGRFDPLALLVLRCLRLAFHPLLWGGLVVAVLRGFLDDELVRLDTPGDIVAALRTPFVGVAIAIGVRFAASVLAFVAAYPVARQDLMTSGREARPALYTWPDTAHLTRSYQALRWTKPVTSCAVDQLGSTGRALAWWGNAFGWLGALLFIAFCVTQVIAG